MNRKKRKTLSKKQKIGVFFAGILAVAGVVFAILLLNQPGATDVFASKPVETLTIKAVPLSGDGTVTVFSTEQDAYQPLVLSKGERYTLFIESDFDTPSVVTVSYDAENIQIVENPDITVDSNSIQFSVGGKKSLQTEITGLNSALFFDGLTIENKDAYTVYAADAGFLQDKAKFTDRTNIDIILLNDIEVECCEIKFQSRSPFLLS